MMSAVLEEPIEESMLWKRVRALQQWYRELSLKVDSLHGKVHDIGAPMEAREPPRKDYAEEMYPRHEVDFLMNVARQEARRNYGGVHKSGGSHINTALLSILIAISAWIVTTLISHGEQLVQIHCQLSPASCLQLQVPHAN
jgi:hypothetical protein